MTSDHDHDDAQDGREGQSPQASEVRHLILEVFKVACWQDPERSLTAWMARNRHVPDLGDAGTELADEGLLERRRPSGRPVYEPAPLLGPHTARVGAPQPDETSTHSDHPTTPV